MSDIYKTVKNIEKGKQLDFNLAIYSNHMMTISNRLAYIRFTMNYLTFYEMREEVKDDYPEEIMGIIISVNELLDSSLENKFSGEQLELEVKRIDDLRNSIISAMKILDSYADALKVYEYVINRVENNFKNQSMPLGYDDKKFTDKILKFLTSDQDANVMNIKLQEVMEQLPFRMTKAKFFQILQDRIFLYTGAEKQAVKDNVTMIKMAAMMERPEGYYTKYPKIKEVIDFLESKDLTNLTKEAYEEVANKMTFACMEVNKYMEFYIFAQGIVNDLYIILLSSPYAMVDLQERMLCNDIISEVRMLYNEEQYVKLNEEMFDELTKLEGKQERLFEQFTAGESVLEFIKGNYSKLLSGLMLDKIYNSLYIISNLLSTSLFIELSQDMYDNSTADKEYLFTLFANLKADLEECLKSKSKIISRAIMSKITALFPSFLQSYNDLEEYIYNSLTGCTDESEKIAAIELLELIMNEKQ